MGKPTRPITDEEFAKMVDTGKLTPDVYSALFLQLNTGLRIQDIAVIEYDKIKYGKLEVIEKKTKKAQITKINMEVVEFLDKLKDKVGNKSKYIFLYDENTKPLTFVRKAQWQIQQACDYSNIDSTFISTHSFRKAFATRAYIASGGNLLLVKYLLNHSSVATTQKYIAINKEEADEFRASQNHGTDFLTKALEKIK